jgi:hypothetical protein
MEVQTDTDGRKYLSLPLRTGELEAIGRVTTSWAVLELAILTQTRGLAAKLGLPVLPDTTEKASFRTRRATWTRLATQYCDETNLTAFQALAAKTSDLANRRNHLTHDILSVHPNDQDILRALPVTARGQQGEPWSVARINQLALDIGKLSYAVLALFGEVRTLPGASRRIRDTPDQTRPEPSRGSRDRPRSKG